MQASIEYMRAYSEDLRTRIVETVQAGESKSATARLFSVSLPTVKRYMRLADRGTSLTPKKAPGRVPKTNQITRKLLEEDIKERPAATVAERRLFLEKVAGQSLSASTVKRLLKRLGYSQKNGQWGRWSETSSKGQPGE